MNEFTTSTKKIIECSLRLFDRIINPDLKVRRMYVAFNHVRHLESMPKLKQLDIFTDYEKKKREDFKEKRRQKAILEIKSRYGKNAILKGMNLEEKATMRKRNEEVGGHRA